jgi:hypothetical protein
MPPPPPPPLGIATSYRRESSHLPASQSSRLRQPFQASSLCPSNSQRDSDRDHLLPLHVDTAARARVVEGKGDASPSTQSRWTSRATGRSHTASLHLAWLPGWRCSHSCTAGATGCWTLWRAFRGGSRLTCLVLMISGAVPVRSTLDHIVCAHGSWRAEGAGLELSNAAVLRVTYGTSSRNVIRNAVFTRITRKLRVTGSSKFPYVSVCYYPYSVLSPLYHQKATPTTGGVAGSSRLFATQTGWAVPSRAA